MKRLLIAMIVLLLVGVTAFAGGQADAAGDDGIVIGDSRELFITRCQPNDSTE